MPFSTFGISKFGLIFLDSETQKHLVSDDEEARGEGEKNEEEGGMKFLFGPLHSLSFLVGLSQDQGDPKKQLVTHKL